MKYTVYVLSSKVTRKSYVGFTNNTERRLKEHNSGKSFYSKRFAPWEIIYIEEVDSYVEARVREKYLKSASGRRLVLKKLFILRDRLMVGHVPLEDGI